MRERKPNIFPQLLVLIAIALGAGAFALNIQGQKDLAPDDSSALYGGTVTADAYKFAGFLISYAQNGQASVCGVTYLSQKIGVTAAHCFRDKDTAYLGYSLFSSRLDELFLANEITVNPLWDGENIDNDLAVVQIPDEFFPIQEFAEIASPDESCNYEILGYGKSETESVGSTVNKLRKKATFCVERIEDDFIYLKGKDGGACFGDSGSPVFLRDTNKLVAIVSSIVTDGNSDANNPCSIGNRVVALRADKNIGFITNTNVAGKLNAKCGESCANNNCAIGLACRDNICESNSGECVAQSENFCSITNGIKCTEGLECSLNKCIPISQINNSKSNIFNLINTSADLDGNNKYDLLTKAMMVSGGCLIVFALFMAIWNRFSGRER